MMVEAKVMARTENFRVHDNACFRMLLSRVGCATLIDEFRYRTITQSHFATKNERTKHLNRFYRAKRLRLGDLDRLLTGPLLRRTRVAIDLLAQRS
jgi:hypothetical protein